MNWLRSEQGAYLAGALLAAIGISATIWATLWLIEIEKTRQQAVLALQAEQTVGVISSRFAQYETLINAARALFTSSEFVTRDEWHSFATTVLAQQDFAGLGGLGWVPRVNRVELAALHELIRADGFSVDQPDSSAEFVCPILYNEPQELNRPSIGLDICQVPILADALERTYGQSGIDLSQPLNLIYPDRSVRPGYVMLAWTRGNTRQPGGWVSASIAVGDLFQVKGLKDQAIKLSIREATSPDTPAVFEIPSSRAERASQRGQSVEHDQYFRAGSQEWMMSLVQPARVGSTPWIALLSGVGGTILLSLTLFLLLCNRSRAVALAEQMSLAYRDSEQLLSSITNNIFEGIYRGHPDDGLVYANRALANMFRYASPEKMIQHAGPLLYANPEQRDQLLELLDRDGYYSDVEVEFVRSDGSRFVGVNNAVAIKDENNRIRFFDGAIYDITARKQAERDVYRLAHYDGLTGLPNRMLLQEHLDNAIVQARRHQQKVAVLFIDLDHFKTINDSLGHDTGDKLLTQVAARLRKNLRDSDIVSRQGGDEFLIVLSEADESMAGHSAQRILDMMAEPVVIDGHQLRVSTSVGVAMYPDDALSTNDLIRNADAAMYLAKEKGRSNFQFFTPELNSRAHERLIMEGELREALANGDFRLHFQPQVNLETGAIIGFEALLRWPHAHRGHIPPDDFIPVAEQSGLIVALGDWVIGEACRQLAAWQRGPLAGIPVSVNVSAIQFWRGELPNIISTALAEKPGVAELLGIELTESALMQDAAQAAEIIDSLSLQGLKIAIDDFGTGYSSLAYLKRFRISRLKVDGSFVRDIATDPDDAAIVAAVISMAADLKLEVIAEGVETRAQVDWLLAHGCHLAQGFLYSPALAPEELMAWSQTRNLD